MTRRSIRNSDLEDALNRSWGDDGDLEDSCPTLFSNKFKLILDSNRIKKPHTSKVSDKMNRSERIIRSVKKSISKRYCKIINIPEKSKLRLSPDTVGQKKSIKNN